MNTEIVGTRRSYWIGAGSLVVSWFAAAIINSLMNALNARGFSGEELLYFRSLPCMAVAFIAIRSTVMEMDTYSHKACAAVAISSIMFYESMAVWKAVIPVIVLIALMPVVNIFLARRDGKKITILAYVSALLLVGGVAWSLDPFSQPFSKAGMILALGCVIVSSVGFDMWSKTGRTVTLWHKGFWLGVYTTLFAILVVGSRHLVGALMGNAVVPISVEFGKYDDPTVQRYLWIFTIFAVVYIYSTIVPFTRIGKMDVVHASIMLQGATPASLIGSWLIIDERIKMWQIPGIICALIGATLVTVQLIRAPAVVSSPAARPG